MTQRGGGAGLKKQKNTSGHWLLCRSIPFLPLPWQHSPMHSSTGEERDLWEGIWRDHPCSHPYTQGLDQRCAHYLSPANQSPSRVLARVFRRSQTLPSNQKEMKSEKLSSGDIIWAQESAIPKDTSALELLSFQLILYISFSAYRVGFPSLRTKRNLWESGGST